MRWRFDDPTDNSFYVFEISAREGGSPSYAKQVSSKSTSGPGGAVIIAEGRDQPQDFTFSGTLLTQEHFDAMVTWFSKRHAVLLTDDLGREFRIYLTEFTPTRKRAAQALFKHDYTCKALVVS